MSSTRYELYRQQVFELARTLVIKYHPIGVAINRGLYADGYQTDADNLASWKYYQNLAGVRYSTDPIMTIKAIENGVIQDIEFTRENLVNRSTTKREYFFGSRFYNDLLRRYPTEEMRIMGVLYPIVDGHNTSIAIAESIQKAIEAEDGTILRFNSDLVEENETNLIPQLETWIKRFLDRWCIQEYASTDDFYIASMLSILYANLPMVIMNIRLANCKTNFAHSFHIREYLESNGKLGYYVDFLNKKQALWLYRNIRYINRNAGKQSTFESLVQNLLTERQLPLAKYDARHNLSQQPTQLYPDVEMFRTPVNFRQVGVGSDSLTVADVLTKEMTLGQEGSLIVADEDLVISSEIKNSLSNDLPTKVLESSVLDLTDSVTYPLADVLLYNWAYRCSVNKYSAPVYFTHPRTGERVLLTAKDAFILYLYCYNYAECHLPNGDPFIMATIPVFTVLNIFRETAPNLGQLKNTVDVSLVSDDLLDLLLEDPLDLSEDYLSTDDFYTAMSAVQQRMMHFRSLWARQQDYRVRGYMEFAANMFFKDVEVSLAPADTLYVDWITEKGIDLQDLSVSDYRSIYLELLRNGTGAGENISKSLRELHAAMISLMVQLSSYSVQYLKSINASAEYIEDAPVIRLGEIDEERFDEPTVEIPNIWAEKPRAAFSNTNDLSINGDAIPYFPDYSHKHSFKISTDIRFSKSNAAIDAINVLLPSAYFSFADPETINLNTAINTTEVPEYGYPIN